MRIDDWFRKQDKILKHTKTSDADLDIKLFCAKHWDTISVHSLKNALMVHTHNCRYNAETREKIKRLAPKFYQKVIDDVQSRLDDDETFDQILRDRIAELGGELPCPLSDK